MAEDSFEFFGTKSEYETYKKENKIAKEDKKEEPVEDVNKTPVRVISYDDAEIVDENTLRMLRRTRHRYDARTVYMQSDVTFYDSFYTSSDESLIDDKELLNEARAIRRVYKSYPEYMHAMDIRDMYIDALQEKVGNDLLFHSLASYGKIYWFPPMPIYSKRAVDYEDGRYGIIDTSEVFGCDDDEIEDVLNDWYKYKQLPENPGDINAEFSVATDPYTIALGNTEREPKNAGSTSVNLADIDELQRIFRSWNQDDTSKQKDTKTTLNQRAFSRTPERIIHDYYVSQLPKFSQSFSDMVAGVPAPSTYNPNEMVYDDVSGKPMSRKEYESRRLLRQLKDAGWSDNVQMMRLLGVGSSREYAIMMNKQRKKKRKSNKVARSYSDNGDTGIYGTENIENLEVYSDLDSLKARMFLD